MVLFNRGLTCSPGRVTPFVSAETPAEVSDGGRGESYRVQGNLLQKGHHLAALLVPDTFISRIEAILST